MRQVVSDVYKATRILVVPSRQRRQIVPDKGNENMLQMSLLAPSLLNLVPSHLSVSLSRGLDVAGARVRLGARSFG